MSDDMKKTKKELVAELAELRQEIANIRACRSLPLQPRKELDDLYGHADDLIAIAPVIMLLLSPGGVILHFNPLMEEISGYRLDEVRGKNWFETFLPERDRSHIRNVLSQSVSGTRTKGNVNPILTKDGREREIEWHDNVLTDENGKVTSLLAVGRDVTDQRQTEKQLRVKEQLLELFFSQSLDGFFFMMLDEPIQWDESVNKDKALDYVFDHQRVTKVNNAMLEQYGYEREEFLGRTPHDLFAHDIAHGRQSWRDFFDTGHSHQTTHETKLDGSPIVIEGDYICLYDDMKRITGHFGIQRDVTDRKQTEKSLENEKRLRAALVDKIPNCLAMILRKGTREIIASNKAAQAIGAVPGEKCFRKFSQRDAPCPWCLCPELWKTGQPQQSEIEYQRKWYEGIWEPLSDDLYVHYIYDITERKQTEKALRESEEKFRCIVENSEPVIFMLDKEGRFLLSEGRSLASLGLKPGEAVGDSAYDIYGNFPEVLNGIRAALAGTVTRGILNVGDLSFDVFISPILDDNGDVSSVAGMAVDITDRKRAEESLRESEQRHRMLIDEMLNAFALHEIICDEKGEPRDYRFLQVNKAFQRLMGIKANAIIGKTVLEVLPNTEPRWIETYGRVALTGESIEFDDYSEALDKHFNVLAYSPKRGQFVTVFTNIAERMKAREERRNHEVQLQRVQKLESLGVLAGGIAHDFNNLLMAVLGNAEIALDDLSPVAPARANINEIMKASKKAAALTKQMLAYSGKGHFIIKTLNLTEIVEEMAHLLDSSTSKKALLKLNLQHDLPPIEADVAQMQQLFLNLIINASEAIGEKSGFVTVSTSVKECADEYLAKSSLPEKPPSGKYVSFEVTDTGCGMDNEAMEKLFDPFFTTKFTGRGLGLSAILGIVRGHHGAIIVDSEVGRGTTITVLFPALKEKYPKSKKECGTHETEQWRGTGIILLVDDEEHVRSVGRAMLERIGFSVLTANDGREGVEIFRHHKDEITCVVLDLTMPRMDGVEAFDIMQTIRGDIPVVIASGYGKEDAIGRFSGKKPVDAIQKPYTLAALGAKMEQVLENPISEES